MQIEAHELIEQFSVEFVNNFREQSQGKDVTIPSTRQSIAISKLLSYRYFKNNKLRAEDFVDAAVVTSFPKIQKIAEEVAKETYAKLILKIKPNLRAGCIE